MNEQYNVVPNIITGKDLDYLSDMFSWNYGCLKSTNGAINAVQDQEIKELLNKAFNFFDDNLNSVLSILNGGQNE